ncbi:MAG: exodeoxyribonuclease V subunit alpha [Actinomycetota bacterium]|nr:exodeoxyribonuclease V subunit alpha [Actinomycetota bacterium]
MTELFAPDDDLDRRLALGAEGRLAALNRAGVLDAADVHVARRLGVLAREPDDDVLLAVAMTVRAARLGSVCLDLWSVRLVAPEVSWPEPEGWWAAVRASPLVEPHGVLRCEHDLLYLDRYWSQEGAVVSDILGRQDVAAPEVDPERLATGLDRLFPGKSYPEQREVAEASVRRWTTVLTGGPGTGKTTTLARLLALLLDQSDNPLRIALAAPTGKAAARMRQAIAEAVAADDFPDRDRAGVAGLPAMTLHRLLGAQRDNSTRFRHNRSNPLGHEVVVVDETSMVSLTMMARLLEAVRPDARLILVGDADQLASVDAGAVLKDLVLGLGESAKLSSAVSRLRTPHRFGGGIDTLATAVRSDDADRAWNVLTSGASDVELIDPGDLGAVRAAVEPPAWALLEAAEVGDRPVAIRALGNHRLLCAHREGPFGAGLWNRRIQRWLQDRQGRDYLPRWYAGQPLVVMSNDYGLKIWNGDTAVVVADPASPSGLISVFEDPADPRGRTLSLNRLSDVQTAHALTVHRAQGSQFEEVTVLLPDPESLVLSRELFYTAITRATSKVRVVASEESVRAAIARPAQRASGLALRLA